MAPTVSVDKCGSNSVDEHIWAKVILHCTVHCFYNNEGFVWGKMVKTDLFSEGFFVCGLGWEGGV